MIDTGILPGIRIYRSATVNANFSAIEFRNYDDTGTNSRIGFSTNSMRIEGTNNLQFVTNSTEVIRVSADKYVGIRTTTPGSRLDVYTDETVENIIRARNATQIIALGVNNSSGGPFLFVNTNHALRFGTNGGEKMRIAANGIVGIGATGVYTSGHILNLSGTGIAIKNDTNGSSNNWSTIKNTAATSGSNLVFQTATGTNVMDDAGKLGLGVTVPGAKLDVRVAGIGPFTGDESNSIIFQGDRHDWIFKQIRTGNATDWNSTTLRLQTRVDSTDMSSIDFVTDSGYNRHIDINTASNAFNTRFTHNGDVGIGNNNPDTKLEVSGSSSTTYPKIKISNPSQTGRYMSIGMIDSVNHCIEANGGSTFLTFKTAGTQKMVIESGGNVGIGVTNPSNQLHVHTDTDNAYAIRIEGSTNNGANVWTGLGIGGEANNTKSALLFQDIGVSYARGKLHLCVNNELNQNSATPADAKLTVSNDGNVGIGDTTPSYKLDVTGTIRATGDVIAFSDARVKDNVVTIDNALDKVNRLRGVTYTRNDIEDKQTKMGVIAQEVLEVIPEVVQQDDKGNYSVAYGNMNGLLIEAIKELKAEIEELKSRL